MNKKIYVGVIGERVTTPQLYDYAVETGKQIAQEGWILVCGGMGGVMEGAAKGVAQGGGVSLGILPGCDRQGQNPYLSYSVVTGLHEARNSLVVRSCDLLIAIGGSYGTLSELSFAKVYGIPAIGLFSWQLPQEQELFASTVVTPSEAITAIKVLMGGDA